MNDITPRRPERQQPQPPNRPRNPGVTPPSRPSQPRPMAPQPNMPLDRPQRDSQIPPQQDNFETSTRDFDAGSQFSIKPVKKSRRKWPWIVLLVLIVIAAGAFGYAKYWWHHNLSPVNSKSTQHVRITIPTGYGPDQIAAELKKADVIRSKTAFSYYLQFQNVAGKLQAGSYNFSKQQSTPEIVNNLTNGKTDTINVTFLPGATLAENKKALIKLGYSKKAVDDALSATYQNAVFAGKPKSSDFEGYLWGETYKYTSDVSAKKILEGSFSEFDDIIKKNDLQAAFKKQGLTLYEGITLASIIQREVQSDQDMKQVAQVFYSRLKKDIPLGSDVTYQYAAKKMGVAPSPDLKSPYNTRIHKGLPPGPISTPGLSALLAVAHPAKGDYLYFLSGDDDKTYFSRTEEQHNSNIKNHCQQKCATP